MKILILALSGIGDALMFTPALQLIKKHFPQIQIDALVMHKSVQQIYDRTKLFNQIFYFNFIEEGFFNSFKFLLTLRKKYNYSVNVYPSNRKEYNVINFLIGANKRAAIHYLRKDFANFGWLNNIRILENDKLHNVEENINLIKKLFNIETNEKPDLLLPLNKDDKTFADKFLIENGINENDLIVGFHPGCSTLKNHINRRWEPEKFIALGKKFIEEKKAKVLIFGGNDEVELKNYIKSSINSSNAILVNTNGILENAAVMSKCKLFITNDSGLMHIASALKLNVVAIIGPTSPFYIHPWNTEYKIVSLNLECSPCFIYSPRPLKCFRNDIKFKCIKELKAEYVYNEALNFLNSITKNI